MSDASGCYERAGRLFDTVVALDPAARAVALTAAATEDPEAVELARRMLERDGGARRLSWGAAVEPESVLGVRLGPYVIESLLGRGGMGAVYLGRRADPDAVVAIELLTLGVAPGEAIERVRREAECLATITTRASSATAARASTSRGDPTW
ncbi:MAG: hypothetical protein AAF628_34480 [Planctomycetota bacterium]